MILPDVELHRVGPRIGHGVFATRDIPRGTIVWVLCRLEQVFSPAEYATFQPPYRAYLDKYTYATAAGDRVLCCDIGRYVNHSCEPSTLTLPGTELEIAVRDIRAGEQLTDDYGTLFLDAELVCLCGSPHCRGTVRVDDAERLEPLWTERVLAALPDVERVEQPLAGFLDDRHRAVLSGRLPSAEAAPV